MAFERFRERHGGFGPLQALYSGLTGGEGVFGQWRPGVVSDQLNASIDAIRDDADLPDSFKEQAEGLRNANLTPPQSFDVMARLQQRSRDIKTINTAFSGFDSQQGSLRERARTAEDRAQLDVLDKQAEYARTLLLSDNEELRALGRETQGRVFSGQQAFATQNEAQELAGQAALGPERWTKYSGLQDNYRQESASFLEQRTAMGRVNAALASPDSPAGDLALVYAYMKILDPGSAVREGEVANAGNAGGVPEVVLTAYNQLLRDGQRLTPEQRKDFYSNATKTFAAARAEQLERDTRYMGQARDVGIPDSMLGHFQLPNDAPGGAPGTFGTPQMQPQEAGQTIPESGSTAENIGSSIREGAKEAGGNALNFVKGLLGVGTGGEQPKRETDEYPTAAPPASSLDELRSNAYKSGVLGSRFFGREVK